MLKKFSLISAWFLIGSVLMTSSVYAEDKPSLEDLVEKPTGAAVEDLSTIKRARLTEEQAIAQLKFMMVNGFKRINDDLLTKGSFKPIGLTLDPDGNFRSLRVDGQDQMPQDVAINAIVRAVSGLAENRTQWAVGIMYVTGKEIEEGKFIKRIIVVAEHIAGWARSWSYPYKIEGENVLMGKPTETEMQPVYYK